MVKSRDIDKLINEYINIAKKYFGLADIKITKTGVIGFLLYLLGHIKKDSEFYYNSLLKELTPVTASEYSSLYTFASLFGYVPRLATPAKYNGNIRIYLPRFSSKLKERKVHIPKYTRFQINNTIWTLNTDIYINETQNYVNVSYYNDEKNIYEYITNVYRANYDNNLEIIEFILPELYQYKNIEEQITLPYYPPLMYYMHTITTTDYLCNINVFVRLPNSDKYEKFDISISKFGYTQNSKVVFLTQKSDKEFLIEFGNGYHGMYLPQNTEVKIIINETVGSKANYTNGNLTVLDSIHVIETYMNGTTKSYDIDRNFISGNILESINSGRDIQTIEELRNELLSFLKSRNILISYDNYYDLLSKYGISTIFRKQNINDNDVYLYNVITNPLNVPYKTISLTLEENEFNPSDKKFIYKPKYVYQTHYKIPLPFITEHYVTNNVNNTNIIPVNTTDDFYVGQEIVFNNDISNIYKIVNIDDSSSTITLDKKVGYLSENVPIQYVDYEKIELISPFLYYKDELLNAYKAFFIEEDDVYLKPVKIYKNAFLQIKLKFTFNDDFDKLTIQLLPVYFDDLSHYSFKLTITELQLDDVILNNTNNYSVNISISEELINQIIDKTLNINVIVFDSLSEKVAEYSQNTILISSIESLMLKKFVYSGTNYILQVPMISFEEYIKDKEIITKKIKLVMVESNSLINYESLPLIQHNIRFSNTIEIYPTSVYLKNSLNENSIKLPLKLKVHIIFDYEKISNDNIIIDELVEQIKLDLAKLLYTNYTGVEIQFYKSKIEDFIHNNKYVKYVSIIEPSDNIIVKNHNEIFYEFSSDKLLLASYCPIYWYFDVNNIEILYDVV